MSRCEKPRGIYCGYKDFDMPNKHTLDNSSPKLTKLTLSLSVKAIRVPISLYEDMLLSDNPIMSKLGGELYFDKYLVIADESLDCVDFDFEYGVTPNDEVTSDD